MWYRADVVVNDPDVLPLFVFPVSVLTGLDDNRLPDLNTLYEIAHNF
jgi:hypothetical protein